MGKGAGDRNSSGYSAPCLERSESLDTYIRTFLDSDLPLGVLTDILAIALGLPPDMKQALLAESRVDRRVDELLDILRQAVARDPAAEETSRHFPPPFSSN